MFTVPLQDCSFLRVFIIRLMTSDEFLTETGQFLLDNNSNVKFKRRNLTEPALMPRGFSPDHDSTRPLSRP